MHKLPAKPLGLPTSTIKEGRKKIQLHILHFCFLFNFCSVCSSSIVQTVGHPEEVSQVKNVFMLPFMFEDPIKDLLVTIFCNPIIMASRWGTLQQQTIKRAKKWSSNLVCTSKHATLHVRHISLQTLILSPRTDWLFFLLNKPIKPNSRLL